MSEYLKNYDEGQAEIFRNYNGNDEASRQLANDLAKISGLVSKAAEGAINLRRNEIYRQVQEQIGQAVHRHQEARREMADNYRAMFEKHVKDRPKPSDTARLADAMELQAKIRAMTTEQLEQRYIHNVTARPEITFKASAFRSPVEYDLVVSELQSRNESGVDVLREAMKDVPRSAIGDAKGAVLLDEAKAYDIKSDADTVLVRDERGAHIGVLANALIDLAPLEIVPE